MSYNALTLRISMVSMFECKISTAHSRGNGRFLVSVHVRRAVHRAPRRRTARASLPRVPIEARRLRPRARNTAAQGPLFLSPGSRCRTSCVSKTPNIL